MKAKEHLELELNKITRKLLVFFTLSFLLVEVIILLNARSSHVQAARNWANENGKIIAQAIFLENLHSVSGLLEKTLDKDLESNFNISIYDSKGHLLSSETGALSSRQSSYWKWLDRYSRYIIESNLNFNETYIGRIRMEGKFDFSGVYLHTTWACFVIVLLFLFSKSIVHYYYKIVLRRILNPVLELEKYMSAGEVDEGLILSSVKKMSAVDEVVNLYEEFCALLARNKRNEISIRELAEIRATAKIAKQVAHDIRSPLSALNMVTQVVSELPEESRLLVRKATQRINDIANSLLAIGRGPRNTPGLSGETRSEQTKPRDNKVMLAGLVEEILSEKRTQYRSSIDIQFVGDFSGGYGVFVQISDVDLGRAISNVLNNSYEAIEKEGIVRVSVYSEKSMACVRIVDNGRGIDSAIASRLGEEGFSVGKSYVKSDSGNGLGLHQVFSVVRGAGGNVNIDSTVGKGTMVTIKLPQVSSPDWFLDSIDIELNTKIISIDDDDSIHQIWSDRFAEVNLKQTISHEKLSYFENSVGSLRTDPEVLYLVDFEFIGHKKNGLEFIEEKSLEKNAVLVTSHYDDVSLRKKCEERGIKILPKHLAPMVPIHVRS